MSQDADPAPPGPAGRPPVPSGARRSWLRFVPTREGHTVTAWLLGVFSGALEWSLTHGSPVTWQCNVEWVRKK